MTPEPAAPDPDQKDWTWVLDRPCPECGFRADALRRTDLGTTIRAGALALAAALERPGVGDRRQPEVWSVLEYGCHVRDVCRIFDQRLQLMLAEDDPLFDNWDQDSTAIGERYWTQDPSVVRVDLAAAATTVADRFGGVAADQWSRSGRRSNGSEFTVDSLARYFVHDLIHHVHDVQPVDDTARPPTLD